MLKSLRALCLLAVALASHSLLMAQALPAGLTSVRSVEGIDE